MTLGISNSTPTSVRLRFALCRALGGRAVVVGLAGCGDDQGTVADSSDAAPVTVTEPVVAAVGKLDGAVATARVGPGRA